ncbi:MAG TPA: hypothetical protein DGT21_15710 [Armatimonadetes bacterium]|jgi:hypothetical protein|nr:hypothetical protein [Armatimonadota bacterium]
MPKEVMRRQAADNEYLHKDFHGAMSCGIQYLQGTYGPEAVIEYLRRFSDAYHSPLKQKLIEQGLPALAEYTRGIYELEGGDIEIDLDDDEMVLRIAECPAVKHMTEHGYRVADMWVETTRTVNERLCEGTPFAFELLEYDERTGRSVQRFYRR